MGNEKRADGGISREFFRGGFSLSGTIKAGGKGGEQEPLSEGDGCGRPDLPAGKRKIEIPELTMRAVQTGKDWTVVITGGTAPHVGCAVLAVPRESLRGDGTRSSTASVLNVTGHKDEEICRYAAERLAAASGRTVVCTGGVHLDGITRDEIEAVRETVRRMTDRLVETVLFQEKEEEKNE